MIHLVLQRILLLGQPRLQMAVEEMETNPQENERKVAETLALDATRVFYSFARSVEHNDACSTLLYDAWFKTPTQGILEQLVPIFATGSTP